MANPNRCMAYVAKNPSTYWTFPSGRRDVARAFADMARADGFRVRETRFKMGPRNAPRWQERVTVSWPAGTPGPDMDRYNKEAFA